MGYEDYLKKTPCHDCKAKPGELHDPGCDTEQCPLCGGQVISCPHGMDVLSKEKPIFAHRLPWTGVMSMMEEAVEYGFFVRWKELPPAKHSPPGKWIKCEKDHPDAMPSRNDVVEHCRWDPQKKRFVKP